MAIRNDIRLDDDSDLSFYEGDFDVLPSADQEAGLIVFAALGDWRHNPLLGVGVRRMQFAPVTQQVIRDIRKQLDNDGLTVKNITGDLSNLKITLNEQL